jgi:hypothetical protein
MVVCCSLSGSLRDTVRCLMSPPNWEFLASALTGGFAGSTLKALPACRIGPHDRVDAHVAHHLWLKMR